MGGWRDQRWAFSSAAFPLLRARMAAESCRPREQKHLVWKVGGNWRWDCCRSPPLGCASLWTRLPEPPRQLNKKLIHGALQKYFCVTCSRCLDVSPSFLFLFTPLCLPQFPAQLASAPLLLSYFSFLSPFSLPQQLKKMKKKIPFFPSPVAVLSFPLLVSQSRARVSSKLTLLSAWLIALWIVVNSLANDCNSGRSWSNRVMYVGSAHLMAEVKIISTSQILSQGTNGSPC